MIMNKKFYLFIGFILFLCLFAGCSSEPSEKKTQEHQQNQQDSHSNHDVQSKDKLHFDHIHGLGFTSRGSKLLLAAHDGLRQYANDEWARPVGDRHDYMGFQVVDDGFFSSGHPEPGHTLLDPLGVVFSSDDGRTVEVLNLLGKTDLHVFAAGYFSNVLYGYNEYPNDIMPERALYVSDDQAKTWKKMKMSGVVGKPYLLAAHPLLKNVVACVGSEGIYLSQNQGATFSLILQKPVTALQFSVDGKRLYYYQQDQSSLRYLEWNKSKDSRELFSLPSQLTGEVIYIAEHNEPQPTFAIATTNNDVWIYKNNKKSWMQIAQQGQIN